MLFETKFSLLLMLLLLLEVSGTKDRATEKEQPENEYKNTVMKQSLLVVVILVMIDGTIVLISFLVFPSCLLFNRSTK